MQSHDELNRIKARLSNALYTTQNHLHYELGNVAMKAAGVDEVYRLLWEIHNELEELSTLLFKEIMAGYHETEQNTHNFMLAFVNKLADGTLTVNKGEHNAEAEGPVTTSESETGDDCA